MRSLDGEKEQRARAETNELAARQRAYASDMNVAKQALDGNNLGRALDLLNRQRPSPAKRLARLGMALPLATMPQRCLVHPLPEIERDRVAGGFSGRSMAGDWTGTRGGLSVWDLRTRQELFHWRKATIVYAVFSPTEPLLAFTSSPFLLQGRSEIPCGSGMPQRDR